MTNAALAITQSAAEQFVRQYFESFGCSIDIQGNHWSVTVPEEADTNVGPGELILVCSPEQEETSEEARLLHPESAFFQELVEEAAVRTPIGSMTLTADDVDIQPPVWVLESENEVAEASFTPYYDRKALTALFHISIETVSEYQTQLLRAISLDTQSKETLPGISREYLNRTAIDGGPLDKGKGEVSDKRIQDLLETAGDEIRGRVQPNIDEVHENASRAADVEFEEYCRLQQQRIYELEERLETLSNRIDDLSDTLHKTGKRTERTEALRQRKQLKEKQNELQNELRELHRQREAGFPEKQREIHDRHALKVRFQPVAVTLVGYETGEFTLSVVADSAKESVTVGYGCGVGVTETVTCDSCERVLTSENPIQLSGSHLGCSGCLAVSAPETTRR